MPVLTSSFQSRTVKRRAIRANLSQHQNRGSVIRVSVVVVVVVIVIVVVVVVVVVVVIVAVVLLFRLIIYHAIVFVNAALLFRVLSRPQYQRKAFPMVKTERLT